MHLHNHICAHIQFIVVQIEIGSLISSGLNHIDGLANGQRQI